MSEIILDGTLLKTEETVDALREDVKANHIEFTFPDGLNEIDLLETCRVLTQLDDFNVLYDYTIRVLEGKTLAINMDDEELVKMEDVNDIDMNVVEYPFLLVWLTEFIASYIGKEISEAYKRSEASTKEKGKTEETGNKRDSAIVDAHFGEPLLFICYEYMHEMGQKPKNFDELFEFLKYTKVKNIIKEMAMAQAKMGGMGNGTN
jgi:hypothetical protein